MFDILIHNGTILTINPDFDIIEAGVVGVAKDRIALIQERDAGLALPDAVETIDAGGGIIMPGLVNTHTHVPMTLFRGLADDLPLPVWLNEHIFPAEGKYINSESVKRGALLACAEMIMSGTTTFCDGYFLENEVATAVCESGMRSVLGHGVIDFPAPGVSDPADSIDVVRAFVERWQDAVPSLSPSVFCHSPYTCSRATLERAKAVADAQGVLFQIHAAETRSERDQIYTEYRTTPIQYLDRIGILDENTLLVHAIWVDDADMEIIAKRRSSISHNPASNMKLASGIAPVPQFLDLNIPVGLGTDGCASNNTLDLFQEMDLAAKLHKVNAKDPTVMDAPSVVALATIGGARAIGLDNAIGSLEIGKQADLIIIDTGKPHMIPMYGPLSHIVYSAKGSDVRDVIVAGKIILRDRRLLTIDLEDAIAKVNAIGACIKMAGQGARE